MRVVEIEWVDSVSEGRWNDKDEALRIATLEAMLHRSVGYLLREDDDMVLIAGSRSENEYNVCDTMQIPKVAVLSMRDLKGAA